MPNADSPKTSIPITPGRMLFEFTSHEDWVQRAAHAFKFHGVRGVDCICVDAIGRLCPMGMQFRRAREQSTFPIRVYLQADE